MKPILLFLFLMLAYTTTSNAQTPSTHTVQRGETIESVAEKYGVSAGALQQANPDIKSYFFVGMKLNIPQKSVVQETLTPSRPIPYNNDDGRNEWREKADDFLFTKGTNENGFTSLGVTFGSDLLDHNLVGMTYGFQGHYFLKNGIGATMGINANFVLEDDPDIVFRVGPAYVCPLSDKLFLMGAVCYTLTLADYKDNKGEVSGASFIPTFGLSLGNFRIGLNGDVFWRNGGDLNLGAFLGVSIAL